MVTERTIAKPSLWGGYVRFKTMEVILSVVFTISYHIVRQFKVMVFPTVFIRLTGPFCYLPAMFLPWRYTLVIPILVIFTSVEPVGSFFGLFVGIQLAYFGSRLLKKYRIISLIFSSIGANLAAWGTRVLIGVIPADVSFPFYMIKTTITAFALVLLAPVILKGLEKIKVIDFNQGK